MVKFLTDKSRTTARSAGGVSRGGDCGPRRRSAFVLLLVLLLGAQGLLSGASIQTYATADPGADSPDSAVANFGSNAASASLVSSFDGSTFDGSASATADFGVLGAFAEVSLDNYSAQTYKTLCAPNLLCGSDPVYASATFTDTLTVTGGVGDAFLMLSFDVDGTSSLSTTLNDAIAQGTLGVFYGPLPGTLAGGPGFTGPISFTSDPIPFTYDDPFIITVQLTAFVFAGDYEPDSGPYDLTGTANFANTATLSGMQVFSDPLLQAPVASFSVLAESGTAYAGSTPVPVPEPSSAFLLGGAFLFVLFRIYTSRTNSVSEGDRLRP